MPGPALVNSISVAVKASREFVVNAPPEVVMEALTDVGVLSSWSPLHKNIEVIDRYPDGRPHHVRTTIKILGLFDKEILEYHWGPDWVCYDARGTSQQHGQHVEYNLTPEGVGQTGCASTSPSNRAGPCPRSSSGGRARALWMGRKRDCANW
jgi:uncharacterized protein YndB with AHSA1/START domain